MAQMRKKGFQNSTLIFFILLKIVTYLFLGDLIASEVSKIDNDFLKIV